MQTFLQHVAASLLDRFGNNLSHVTVVFPGKRAGLFLEQALAQKASGPVWSPRYCTISDLFAEFSPYTLCDSVEAVCRLHRAYMHRMEESAQTDDGVEQPQSLDQFYGWGEILLADFDDLDKHLVDAHRLFANIHDLRALDDTSYITEEQEAALRRFFSNFSVAATTELRKRFLRLWLNMGEIYDEFRKDMLADGLLYEGALQRLVVEQGIPQTSQTYAFVGFNVLNDVEMALFDQLRSRQQALFYWDYDVYYTSKRDKRVHEAGLFMRRNLERYGNELDSSLFNNLNTPKEIVFVTSSTETVQTRYIPQWLQRYKTTPDNQTAVVLCNEHLLQPTLQSLPPGQVNITMGFPLADTPVCTFVNELMALYTDGFDTRRRRFRYPYLRRLLCHPYASALTLEPEAETTLSGVELITRVIDVVRQVGVQIQQVRQQRQPSSADILNAEAVFKAYTLLNRILSLMTGDKPLLAVSDSVLCRIVRAAMQQQTIPFHGEPATGLQVMGVLETRALDFRHILMLSVGEGFLPRSTSEVSFIPYSLREAFGLTTVRHKTAVYAYYFYRLLQRAESITYVFNNSTAGVRQNEMSRFLRQLMAETDFPISHLYLQSKQQFSHSQELVVEKTDTMLVTMRENLTSRPISPTALNTYTTCPMQFYYKYVQGLRVDPDPEDGLDQLLFGNIFHRAAELAYRQLTATTRVVQAADIRRLLSSDQDLDTLVDAAFEKEFFKGHKVEYTGILIIARRVVRRFLTRLLRYDIQHAPITILGIEHPTQMSLQVGDYTLSIGGFIDRVDQITTPEGQTQIRIVDYKTGSQPASNNIASFSALFKDTGQKEHYAFQTMLYAISTARKLRISHPSSIKPCLYYLPQLAASNFQPGIKIEGAFVEDVMEQEQNFISHTSDLIAEIFNTDVPFTQIQNDSTCRFCNYRTLCGKV